MSGLKAKLRTNQGPVPGPDSKMKSMTNQGTVPGFGSTHPKEILVSHKGRGGSGIFGTWD